MGPGRRALLRLAAGGLAGGLAAPRVVLAEPARVLRFVPAGDVIGLDPVWTPTYPTRDHALAVFDTLYGQDATFRAVPQMIEQDEVSADGLAWRLRLRPGLRFHDGTPVLARDCVASIARWASRDAFGGALIAATEAMTAADDRTLVFRLRRPFPLLRDALGKAYPRLCVIMPERLARTDPATQVTEMVGSGPFRFRADERVPGERLVYERFEGYEPRPDGAVAWTGGPKVARFDRVEWRIIADPSTAMSALLSGEVDWWAAPDADLVPRLARSGRVQTAILDPTGQIGTLRFNHLTPPFDNPALRRAVLGGIVQAEFMQAVAGADPALIHTDVGFFCPGTPFANETGMAALNGVRDPVAVRRAVAAAGYGGEPVVVLTPTDIASQRVLADVAADQLRRMGLNVRTESLGWGALIQRRFRTEPVSAGGWSVFCTFWGGLDQSSAAGHAFLRGNGMPAGPGWPTSRAIEALRDQWLAAPGLAAQQEIAARLQAQAFEDVPYVPLGQYTAATAYRQELSGIVPGVPVFWNVQRRA